LQKTTLPAPIIAILRGIGSLLLKRIIGKGLDVDLDGWFALRERISSRRSRRQIRFGTQESASVLAILT
jgi:hypothetical protein